MISLALMLSAAGPLVFENAKVEVGDGTTLPRATVVIDGGRIVSVGPGPGPKGVTAVDASKLVITPGLIHVGSQVGMAEIGLESGTVDSRSWGTTPALRALDGYNPSSPRVAIDRAQGVTTAVLSPVGGLLSGTGHVVDLTGRAPAAARTAGVWGAFGGAARDSAGPRGRVALELALIFDDARFYRANRPAFDKNASRTLALAPVHLRALGETLDKKQPLVLAADRESDIRALLAFAEQQKMRVIVWSGAEAWKVAPEIAKAQVPVVLVPSSGEPYSFDALQARDDNAALLEESGVSVMISSGYTDLGTTRVRQEAGVAVSYGLPYGKAMRAVTLEPARAFGLDKELGTIEKGKRANLVVWTGDPFETSSRALTVIIDGVEHDLANRQTALARRYRDLNRKVEPKGDDGGDNRDAAGAGR